MKNSFLFLSLFFISIPLFPQKKQKSSPDAGKPKLIVGIVVDQMRQEYLYRFSEKYGNDGFKLLVNEGFMLKNAHYNYAPTYTGPGHASIYSGTTPSIHGIIGNDFYDRALKQRVNCVGDPRQQPIGSAKGNGDVSPWRMLSSTITDELKLSTQRKSKVISVSIKDRGAVLPGGHLADAAYWYDDITGGFISSSYYMQSLPEWLQKFNGLKQAETYLTQTWNTTFPIEQYFESGPDESPYEGKVVGKEKATFPYNLSKTGNFKNLVQTPFANDYLTELAKAALVNEGLGKNGYTDFLCVSYSSPDILGHIVGPNSIELEDMYIRLDKNIADLIKTLNKEVGEGNYTLFLTADHAAADVPQYFKDLKIPAGYYEEKVAKQKVNELLKAYPGVKVEDMSNLQVFLKDSSNSPATNYATLLEEIGKSIKSQEGVVEYYTSTTLKNGRYDEEGIKGMLVRGYHPKRSGDIAIVLEPSWFEAGYTTGTTHGSPYSYDTHVPVLFYGKGVKKGSSVQYHAITDIAPTLSIMLNLKFPSGCTGQPIKEILE